MQSYSFFNPTTTLLYFIMISDIPLKVKAVYENFFTTSYGLYWIVQ